MYCIVDGVRRAVAAREFGIQTINVIVLDDGGKVAERKRVRLTELISPKLEIRRDHRFTKLERSQIEVETIEVKRYAPFGCADATPLMGVALVSE